MEPDQTNGKRKREHCTERDEMRRKRDSNIPLPVEDAKGKGPEMDPPRKDQACTTDDSAKKESFQQAQEREFPRRMQVAQQNLMEKLKRVATAPRQELRKVCVTKDTGAFRHNSLACMSERKSAETPPCRRSTGRPER